MTSSSLPQHNSDVHQHKAHKAQCCVSFTSDEVHVAVEKPADHDAADKERCNSAHRQCLQLMAASPPNTFDCEISGKVSAPRTRFILQRAMLEKLPLLLDIAKSTSNEQRADAHLELPCSVLGFASLLFLLEGKMKPNEWFRADSETCLPIQTLLVCPDCCERNELANPDCK
jgi:hypothetical protein